MSSPIDILEYLKKEHIVSEQRLFVDYYRDIIRAYGLRVNYFRQNNTFPNEIYERFQNLIYEEHIPVYGTSAELQLYLESATDAFMLTKFGIEPDQKYTAYFMIKDFEFAFATLAEQQFVSSSFETIIQISANSGTILYGYSSSDDFLSGVISSSIFIPTTGNVDGIAAAQYHNYNDFIFTNPDIVIPNTWNYTKSTFSSFHGPYTGTLDQFGNGEISANLNGVIVYKKIGDLETNFYKKVKPLPKDYFSIPFTEQNNEQFEITHVISRNIMPNGINPLLTQNVYACNVQRREFSHEDGIGDAEEAVKQAVDMNTTSKNIQEYSSDEIFNYREKDIDLIDKQYSDRIFGGYGATVSALPNSPISSIEPNSYVGNISGIVFNFIFGSTLFTDGMEPYFVPAGQDIGSSLISNSVLPLSSCSGNTTKLRYFESDGNNLYFRNLSGVSATITTDEIDNVYLRDSMEINGVFEDTSSEYAISGMIKKILKSSLFSDGEELYFINAAQHIFSI